MRCFSLLILCFLSFSCTSKSQEKRDSVNIRTDSLELTAQPSSTDTLTLLFAGDLMQHQTQINAARTSTGYNYSPCFEYVKEHIRCADWAIGNLEVTLGGKPYQGYPTFSAPDEYLTAIHEAGFDVLITANNHCLDKSRKGLERTLNLLDSLQIPHAGTYRDAEEREKHYPLLLEKKRFRIALLNYTYGTNGIEVTPPNVVNYIDTALISGDIEASRKLSPHAIIACMHWGEEYHSYPSHSQKWLTDWLLEKGVTHIIGSHPHVVQPIEVRQDSLSGEKHLVVYSLGNYLSNMSARRTDGGLMVEMKLVKDSVATRLADCGYSLVWTARPAVSGKKVHQLIPIDSAPDSLQTRSYGLAPAALRQKTLFVKDSRKLFREHNVGIEEKRICH